MAEKFVFIVDDTNHVNEELISYQFFAGFADCQRKKCVQSLHKSIHEKYEGNVLEVSTKSDSSFGASFSPFNLMMNYIGKRISFENVFQSSKVFENGLQCIDLLYVSPREAKKDLRIKESGPIVAYVFEGKTILYKPTSSYYDYLYSRALEDNPELTKGLSSYSMFTDIEFIHSKYINCQARSVAIFAALLKSGLLDQAMTSYENFVDIVKNNIYSKY